MASNSPSPRGMWWPELKRAPAELVALGVLLIVYLGWLVLHWIPGSPEDVKILFLPPIDALVVLAAVRAARRCGNFPALRMVWLFLALAWTSELLGDVIQAVYIVGFSNHAYPSLADPFYLAFYPLLMLALLRVPTVHATPSQRARMLLDCATIVIGGAAAVWYLVLGPTVIEGGQPFLGTIVSIAFPIGDLLLLAALAVVLMRRSPAALHISLGLIAAGLLALITADMIYGAGVLNGTYSPGDPVDTLYLLVPAPFILAAARQRRMRSDDPDAAIRGSAEPSPELAGCRCSAWRSASGSCSPPSSMMPSSPTSA